MATITFDTMRLVDALEQVQIPREQARAIVEVVRTSHDAADVATKGDIALVHKEIAVLEAKMEAKIAIARRDTIIWLGGISIAGFSTVIGVLFKLVG